MENRIIDDRLPHFAIVSGVSAGVYGIPFDYLELRLYELIEHFGRESIWMTDIME